MHFPPSHFPPSFPSRSLAPSHSISLSPFSLSLTLYPFLSSTLSLVRSLPLSFSPSLPHHPFRSLSSHLCSQSLSLSLSLSDICLCLRIDCSKR